MKQITQPTTLPEWFMQANSKAQFSIKEIATLLNCCEETARTHLMNQESRTKLDTNSINKRSGTRKFFSKQTVLTFIQTLPTLPTGEHS